MDEMAAKIAKMHPSADNMIVLGMASRGIPLAQKLSKRLSEKFGKPIETGSLDATHPLGQISLMVHNPVIYQAYAAEAKHVYTEFAREVTEAAIDFVGNTINIEGDEIVGLDEQMPMEEV